MKREFLQNFKVGDQPLTKEIIDAIMAENGRDVEAAKKPYADYDDIKAQLETAQNTITQLQQSGQSNEDYKQKASDWEQKYNKAVEDHKAELADRDFRQQLETAIATVRGKNVKAITAMLDVDTLKASEKPEEAIKAALEAVQKDHGYLFDTENPPPYARGTGTGGSAPEQTGTLADALRERFSNSK